MDSQTRIGVGVIGVLLILFLVILYSRFSGDRSGLDLNIHSPRHLAGRHGGGGARAAPGAADDCQGQQPLGPAAGGAAAAARRANARRAADRTEARRADDDARRIRSPRGSAVALPLGAGRRPASSRAALSCQLSAVSRQLPSEESPTEQCRLSLREVQLMLSRFAAESDNPTASHPLTGWRGVGGGGVRPKAHRLSAKGDTPDRTPRL